MAKEYLDKDGLAYFWTKIKAYVAAHSGGGLTMDDIYPVGSIYMSVNNVSPQTFLGGTWIPIEDTFLLAAGTNHSAGDTGGAETVTLTAAESGMPAHGHGNNITYTMADAGYQALGYRANANTSSGSGRTGPFGANTSGNTGTLGSSPNHKHTLTKSGGVTDASAKDATAAHENMPPYLAVYMWKRTA